MKYVALLRGINVGKSVQVPMKELKALLEGLGFRNIVTYLNSGNALFESNKTIGEVTKSIEYSLEQTYHHKIATLVKTSKDIISIAESIPLSWKNDNSQQTYVAYLFKEIAKPSLIDELPIRKEYMNIYYHNGSIIWNIKRVNYNKSHITKIAEHSSYIKMTTRNSNTARKLAELCK